ncbi:MAG: type III pantothenate kinase [Myxococcota bacterium]|jgi:type III pantothenate kinase
MLLVVDVGNTNIVLGVYDGQRLVHNWRLETRPGRTSDEYGTLLIELCSASGVDVSGIDAMIVSCVVPPLLSPLSEMGRKYLHLSQVMVVGQGIRTGMPIKYENPREVGADRIVNSVAAYEHVGRASGLIVCDFGTATTFDVVSPAGAYLGGAIAPGIGISMEALFRRASKLPRIDLVASPPVIGRNTVASMQSGVLYGYVGLVDGIIRRMQTELTFATRVLATGGLASLIAGESEMLEEVLPMLTLQGLRILFERNQPAG